MSLSEEELDDFIKAVKSEFKTLHSKIKEAEEKLNLLQKEVTENVKKKGKEWFSD